MAGSRAGQRGRGPALGYRPYVAAAAAYAGLGFLSILLLAAVVVSIALTVIWVGMPLLAASLRGVRSTSRGYRRVATRLTLVEFPDPYRPVTADRLVDRLRGRLSDPATYRDLAWVPIGGLLGMPLGIVSSVFWLIFPLGILVCPPVLRLFASVSAVVLRRSDPELLRERIGQLASSRTETVESQAAEIRRIERDLHDGAQAQLVALSMNIGLAEQLLTKDPEASRELMAESRASAVSALDDLRRLVRGIHPPVLADRGLVGAVQALALQHPVELSLDLRLDGRPSAPVESAAYFAICELLTNSAKHSRASYGWVQLSHSDGLLHITVGDDGLGGAQVTDEGGLRGVQHRLEAFDGTLSVTSPAGGPTIAFLELPCELSSEKTSRS